VKENFQFLYQQIVCKVVELSEETRAEFLRTLREALHIIKLEFDTLEEQTPYNFV